MATTVLMAGRLMTTGGLAALPFKRPHVLHRVKRGYFEQLNKKEY